MIISFDLETALIQPGNLQPKPIVASVALPGRAPYLMAPKDAAAWIALELSAGATVVGQHIQFDMGVLVAHFPAVTDAVFAAYSRGLIRDTRIREQLLDISTGTLGYSGYSLADLEKKYLGRDRSADKTDPGAWRLRYAELDGVPLEQWPAEARDYALADAQGTLEVYEAQARRIGATGLAGEALITRSAFALHLMSCRGLITEAEAVARLKAELEAQKAQFSEALGAAEPPVYKLTGSKKAIAEGRGKWTKDMAAIKARVEAAYPRGAPTTDKGAIATDRDTLERSGDPILQKLAEVSGIDKLISTYVPILERGTQAALMPSYGIAESGRTTCSGGREGPDGLPLGMNVQNMPRNGAVREAFVPRAGHLFVSVDYDTLELRALAQVCLTLFGRSSMADAIRAGKDLHLEFASHLLGIPYDEALRRKKEPEVKEARQFAKVANFGMPGGLGATTFVEFARTSGVQLNEYRARQLKAQWLRAWPEMSLYFERMSRLAENGPATLKSVGTGFVRGGVGYTAGCNHGFQHLAAMGARAACFDVTRECYAAPDSPLFGSRPVAFVHDEIIAEVPIETAHEASTRLAEVMCNAMRAFIPDVPVTASPALMARWYKGAVTEYDSVGRLVPWFPAKSVA